jgi:hypothetical protein
MNHHDHREHRLHEHGHPAEPSLDDKLLKLLEHWIRHNQEHALTYSEWAARAAAGSRGEVAVLLNEAVGLSVDLRRIFEQALTKMRGE